jgi:prepilin-type N-terminal cleavage/methylation domain-containing protein
MLSGSRGMTLLEMVLTLIVLGMLAVGASAILYNGVLGALQTRNDTATAENAQAALTRIAHEIANINTKANYSIDTTNMILTYYYRTDGSQSVITRTGTNITIQANGGGTYTLMNNVTNAAAGFTVSQPYSAYSVQISIQVAVPSAYGTAVSKTYTTVVDLNDQRFQ